MSVTRSTFREKLRERSARAGRHFGTRDLSAQERADRYLTLITGLIAFDIFLEPPLIASGLVNRHLADVIAILIVVGAVGATFANLRIARIFILFACVLAAIRAANYWLPDAALRLPDALFALAAFALLAWFLMVRLLRPRGRVNFHRVVGAVAVYLVLGLMFAQAHRIVAMTVDGAYLLLGQPTSYGRIVPLLNYFSFVVLTSLGFGDITPAHPVAQSLVTLEALVGVLFPAILISRLVSLEVHPREDD